jgi:Mg2+ and Co2+ transporter CorA
VQVRFIDAKGAHPREPDDVVELFAHDDGFFWIDIAAWDAEADAFLEGLGCHPRVREACGQRNFVPTVHGYEDHVFVTLHSPLLGVAGHVHLLELDQVIAHSFLVTVHGPLNPDVEPSESLVETEGALRRIEGGRFRPATPAQLSHAIASGVARRQSALVHAVAAKLPGLEQDVMASTLRDPEALLETMFLLRHELITARTMAVQCHNIWVRMAGIGRLSDDVDSTYARDLAAQFQIVQSLADGEAQFLFGVIELYQTKVHTKMTVAMERLAVIAAVTLPVTAIASVYGMNVIVNDQTRYLQLGLALALMLAISLALLRWTKRQGWW